MSDSFQDQLFDFVRELYPNESPVPLHAPRFMGNEKKYLAECIDSTFVSYVGPFVQKFEQSVAKFVGSKHAVSMCNGTVALHLALEVAGVKPGDEVLVPSLTFVAAANAVSHAGGVCVLVDSDPSTLGMCPEKLESFLVSTTTRNTNGECYNKVSKRRIGACLPVHIFGHPAKIEALTAVCSRFGIPVIEDASESLGSYVGDRHTGTFGVAAVLSFNGNKTVTTGGGGMVITNDDSFAERVRFLATTAKKPHAYEFVHDEVGYNYRMPNVNAAIGLAQMETLPTFLDDKRDTALRYQKFFDEKSAEGTFFGEPAGSRSNFWLNAIVLKSPSQRDDLLRAAVREKVQLRPIWKLMHHLPMYSDCQKTTMEVAEKFEASVINLPSSVKLAKTKPA